MKLLKTNYSELPMRALAKLEFGDNLKITQLDETGLYVSTTENTHGINGTFTVDKKQLANTLSIVGNDFVIKQNENDLTFIKGETKIKLKLITDQEINLTIDESVELKELPNNFMEAFKEASKFSSIDPNRLILNTVKISSNLMESTNTFITYTKQVELNGVEELALPRTSFDIIDKPTHYGVVNGKLIISDGTNMGQISLYDGVYPKVQEALNGLRTTTTIIPIDTDILRNVANDLIKLEKDKIVFEGKQIKSSDNEFILDTSIDFGDKRMFNTKLFAKGLLKELSFAKNSVIFKDDDKEIVLLQLIG